MNTALAANLDVLRPVALELLGLVRARFAEGVTALARACAVAGQIDAVRVDEQQPACFELAWANAELLAAETALQASSDASTTEGRLALAFAAEALPSILQRLEAIAQDIDQDTAPLQALQADVRLSRLKKLAASTPVLRRLGAAVAGSEQELAAVALDGDVAMAQEAFRRFAAEQVAPVAADIHRQDLTVPESLLQPLREMGVFGLSIPEAFGGSAPAGSDNTLMMITVTEALSEASLAAAGSLITRPEILARALMTGGSEAQKAWWLPRIAAGEPLVAISITEPDYGSDVASLGLRASRTEGGWLLNGAKTWCTFAGKAGVLMVVARTDPDRASGHRGLSLMLVEKPSFDGHEFEVVQPAGGRLTGHAIATIGYRGMHSYDLAFENFFVPADRLIGEEQGVGKGFYFTMAGMVGGRIQTAARACGVMRASLRAAIQYARDRQVFGAALMDYSLTQVKVARMAARFNACRQLTYAVARRLESGGDRMEASLIKLLACRCAEIISREALQLHGGMGYAEEMPVSRYFVDARVLSIFEGAEETLALKVVTRSLLDAAVKAA